MKLAPGVTADPNVMHGAAVIQGTRIPVSLVVGSLGGRMSREDIVREYEITDQDIDNALAYAGEVLARMIDVPLPVA